MNDPKNEFRQIPAKLLSFLKEEPDDTKIDFFSPPTKLEGGNETTIFHFKLNTIQPSLSKPLILRKFRKEHRPNHAISFKL